MIQWMSRLSKSWVASLLMGGLALSFVVWGIADVFTGASASSVASVGGVEIGPSAFQRSYRNFVRNEGQQMGAAITPDMAQKMGLPMVALQQLVSRTALDNVADKLGLTTTDADVAQYVRTTPSFSGAGGFDHATFLRMVEGAGYSEQDFLNEVRADMTRQQLTAAVEGGMTVPTGYAQALFRYLNERRAVRYIIVAPSSVGEIASPGDAVLASYVQAHAARYSTPEYRDVTIAEITPADVAGQATVTDAQIAQYYAANKATYNVPEKRTLEQIEFPNEVDARAARARIDHGATFDAVAAGRKLKPADIALGTVAASEIPDAATAAAAFGLPAGGISQPVKGAFGWVLLHVSAITPGVARTLDQAKDDIRKLLATQVAQEKLVDVGNAFQDAHGGGASLEQAAQKAGMKLSHVVIDQQGLAPSGETAAAPPDPELRAQIFAADVGADSDAFATKAGNTYAIKVNGVTAPKLKSIDQVRDAAYADWSNEQRAKIVAARTAELTKTAQQDGSLDGVAKTLHLTVQDSPGLGRGTDDTTFSNALVTRLFAMAPLGIASGPQGSGGNYIIAQVTGIAHPAVASDEYKTAAAQLGASVGGDLTVSLANAARATQGVKVNQKLVDQVVNGGGS